MSNKKVLAIIPARGGSKRVPGKNIKLLNGLPLIEYTYIAAKNSKQIDEIVLSTDTQEIADSAKLYDEVKVPFLRPAELSGDSVGDIPVIEHALLHFSKLNKTFDYVVYLRPTSPFKTSELIDEVILKIKNSDFTGIRTITPLEGVFHPYWAYRIEDEKLVNFCAEGGTEKYYQSQLLPNCYRLNGVVDCFKVENLKLGKIYGDNCSYVQIDDVTSVDIDTEQDFRFAEFLMKDRENERY
ncbi:acylneuraminate cytidylyltransferase family protein [Halobacteriovorax sp. RZ-1]|uniref:acylneuraminate cytidylyltransferase family protein n=1 Tax=unclassified Halobacteriovorax TaxID=2639665 RepID=UPI00371A38D7